MKRIRRRRVSRGHIYVELLCGQTTRRSVSISKSYPSDESDNFPLGNAERFRDADQHCA